MGGTLKRPRPADIFWANYLTYPPFNGIIHVKVQHPNDENSWIEYDLKSWDAMLDFFNNQPYNWRVLEMKKK